MCQNNRKRLLGVRFSRQRLCVLKEAWSFVGRFSAGMGTRKLLRYQVFVFTLTSCICFVRKYHTTMCLLSYIYNIYITIQRKVFQLCSVKTKYVYAFLPSQPRTINNHSRLLLLHSPISKHHIFNLEIKFFCAASKVRHFPLK